MDEIILYVVLAFYYVAIGYSVYCLARKASGKNGHDIFAVIIFLLLWPMVLPATAIVLGGENKAP